MNDFDLQWKIPLQHPMLETAMLAAHLSARVLRERFQTTVAVKTKGLANFVTQADLDSEKIIVQTLRDRFQTHSFIAEESHRDRADAKDLWIIDPLECRDER